jgi:predicted Zn-dependent peptidase
MDDLRKVTKSDLVDFHNRTYVPNNAVAVYVGDLDPQNIIRLAEAHFGRILRGPDVEPVRTGEPAQFSEKRLYGEGPAPTSLQMMFHTPPDGDPDTAALAVLADVLGSGGGGFGFGRRMGGGGGTGRLYKLLVEAKQMAVTVSAFSRPQWYVGAFTFNAMPRIDKNVQPEDLEKEIWAELDKVKKEGLTAEEIQKAKNRLEVSFIRSLSMAYGLAAQIGRAELNRGWRSLLTNLDEVLKVGNEDIKRVAAKYFVKDNSLTAIYKRKMGR